MKERILIVDDEAAICETLQAILQDEGYDTITSDSAEDAQRIMTEQAPEIDAALLDIWMPGMDGLTLLDWLRNRGDEFPVIMMSGHGTIETAVKATKKGAYDFIEKPLSLEKLLLVLSHALKEIALVKENKDLKEKAFSDSAIIIGASEKIHQVLSEIEQAAPTDGWVMITGENGTGKELAARQIHIKSLRQGKPFMAINCAAIPDDMIESELFGYEKGAFPGAVKAKIGKFEQANSGTLFLDEIADMSLKTQAKILRVLQEMKFNRLGGSEEIELDLRIITASNKNLEAEIQAGNFREDLFYRFNVIPIHLPPLRERPEDIQPLSNYFIEQFIKSGNYSSKTLTEDALDSLKNYHWPGNIRELKNIVERMVIMVKAPAIELNHVPPVIRLSNAEMLQVNNLPKNLAKALEAFEVQFIAEMLKKASWNLSTAAEELEIDRVELQQKIQELNIVVPVRHL